MTTEKKQYQAKMFIIVLLTLNVLLGIYIAFFKRDALWLETMKAGGSTNMNMARQLYNSPAYIQQQKSTLDQILGSMNQAAPTAETPTVELPAVTQ
ncbi:MAG: hypothetical protein ACD_80C00131G0028 [uncultured bacterium (gcode 4)]|uniref:Uncharacterized protein n=1 Tax=uncultured bacterium (gcode 4) TaxID=1234023 RepID=K1X4H9_9BACT|nr:MAG: hypothetical protein ACD_80C00131G0028 [uncultured bacterium (gcode 4)]HBB04107.1 hypothetical protein [Candidatus Gracilibacteria bacterium]